MIPHSRSLRALLLVSLLLLPGCFALQRLLGGSPFVLPPTMPLDFEFAIDRRGAREPELDYMYRFGSNGVVQYRVRAPGALARVNQGSFEVSGNQILEFYALLRDQGFEAHAEGSDPGLESDGSPLIQGAVSFYGTALGREKTVSYHDQRLPPDLSAIHAAAFALIPAVYRSAEPVDDGPHGRPERFVGDTQTKYFFPSDAKGLEDVPPERRVFFTTPYEAVDHGYFPDPDSRPFERWKAR